MTAGAAPQSDWDKCQRTRRVVLAFNLQDIPPFRFFVLVLSSSRVCVEVALVYAWYRVCVEVALV